MYLIDLFGNNILIIDSLSFSLSLHTMRESAKRNVGWHTDIRTLIYPYQFNPARCHDHTSHHVSHIEQKILTHFLFHFHINNIQQYNTQNKP